jgi:hypothetical protein
MTEKRRRLLFTIKTRREPSFCEYDRAARIDAIAARRYCYERFQPPIDAG